MPLDEPDATSTPTTVPHVKGRKSTRDIHNSVQSPIDLEKSEHVYGTYLYYRNGERIPESATKKLPEQYPKRSPSCSPKSDDRDGSYDSNRYSDSEGLSSDGEHYELVREKPQAQGIRCFVIIGVVVLLLAFLYFTDDHDELSPPPPDLPELFKSLEKEFNGQEADFWRSIKVSIQEIPILDQPATIIFLYNNKAENTLNQILKEIAKIALCNLTQCSNNVIEIEGASLGTSNIVNDYGKIISKYRDGLERNGVMIVKNLEKVPGVSAQAFHSFCDNYNPVVKKALILFTMKVERLPEGYPTRFVEDLLLKLWNDLGKDDKFYPLFTRISGTILSVRPQ